MRTHPTNVTSLVLGLLFLGLAGSWLLYETGTLDASTLPLALPLLLVLAGGLGVLAYVGRTVRSTRSTTLPGPAVGTDRTTAGDRSTVVDRTTAHDPTNGDPS